ncbi:hybrid sensor histidine kinase/response regulator [Stutzerimonas urumqiensis]|uniref:hybrid sensor histidine kinase/response regulator n=1 Tax=Stutzerimonas urumqiensis TaxID=638269 RepID=UPI000EAD7A6D|nr:ATP-binding protein [Stutzerimonas urumqiensis]
MPAGLVGVRQWIWRAFVRSALIPLILVETGLIAVYLLSNNAIRDAQIEHLRESALSSLRSAVELESRVVDGQLTYVTQLTALFGNMTRQALLAPEAPDPPALALSLDGVRFSPADDGGAASFYASSTPVAEQDLDKVARLSTLDPLMEQIKKQNPLVASLYFNSWDSYNHIYPWFLTPSQYPHDMVIPGYNFYYLADGKHNPDREVVWTDVYLDPAGHGWMMSAITPVYRGDFLEGVSGIDITVGGILTQIDQLRVPWNGYAVLVSDDLNIMALPAEGEEDFGLNELTAHSYNEAIRREIFKPEDFNLAKREPTRALAQAIANQPEGVRSLALDGRTYLVAWSTIAQTGWHLLAVVDEADIFHDTHLLASRYRTIGYLLIAGLAVFYLLYFCFLWLRARGLSQRLLEPIAGISNMIAQIGQGNWRPARPVAQIRELDQMAAHAGAVGLQLEQSEARRRTVQRNLELVLECATESLWELNLVSSRVTLSGRIGSRFGLPSASLSQEFFMQRIHPQDLPRVRQAMQRVEQGLDDRYEAEYRFADQQGRYVWLLSRGRVVERDADGQPTLLAGTHIDIDALKLVEAELRQASETAQAASQAKSRFISSMSHELRTPLNAIQGFAQLMQLEGRRDDTSTDYAREILAASRHLSQLVTDILDWSSIQAERPRLDLQPVSLAELMGECAGLVRLEIERQGLVFDLDLPPAKLRVRADARRLRQVLLNLLSNAIKYNRPHGRVKLAYARIGERIRLQVEDTGFGISPALQDKLFEPFQRLGQENTSIQGTGIGLSLCREYANLMDAEIGLTSTLGAGSCFWIEMRLLPAAAPSLPGQPGGEARALPHIRYVEDNPTSQFLIRKALADLATVSLSGDGREALTSILAEPPDLVLLDLNLPGMNGDELLRCLRADPRTRDVPVIMLSAATGAELEALHALGCDAAIGKPVDLKALRSQVQALLERKGLRPEG